MSIAGTWYNELGSMMTLDVEGTTLVGTYQTAVGNAEGIYQLTGSVDVAGDPSQGGQATAWVVLWNNQYSNSHSVTAWSGQYQVIGGVEEIETLWLLTSETPAQYDWAATQVNKDTFTRTEPSEETVMRARKKRMPSHPI